MKSTKILVCLQGDAQYPKSFQQTMGTPVITFSKPYMYFCAAREYHFGKLLSYATTFNSYRITHHFFTIHNSRILYFGEQRFYEMKSYYFWC